MGGSVAIGRASGETVPAAPARAPGVAGGDRSRAGSAVLRLGLRLASAAILASLVAASPLAVPGVRASSMRVAIIVGPVGSLTGSYRADAEKAAAEARRFTDDVVTVYSPNATWGATRVALRGASIVVYLGHGNGWPSRYGRTLNQRTQNGLGLNPVAGVDNVAHQYFGESYLAAGVELAPNAIVILSHLCYASGNSEPGLPEGTLDVAKQRVDNFAAGWMAAGAGAVLVDAFQGPAHYVRAILSGRGTLEQIWRAAPSFHGHVLAFPSVRTRGLTALMDPTNLQSGFYRSLVTRADLRADEVARGATARAADPAGPLPATVTPPGGWEIVLPPQPSVAPDAFDLGSRPGTPALAGMPLAASTVQLRVPVEVPAGVQLGTAYRLGTRWIPLDEEGVSADPTQGTDPSASHDPGVADEPALVARESAASLVDVVPATVAGGSVSGDITLPATSGRYRLEVTLHDGDGVALPYAVQASIPGVVVHVGGPGAAWLEAPPAMSVTAGTLASLQVVVTNGEPTSWGSCAPGPRTHGSDDAAACPTVRLTGRWVALVGSGPAAPMTRELSVPAATARTTWLSGPVPTEPGTYLLVASLERVTGDGPPLVLGRPITVTVLVAAAPLVPTPAGTDPTIVPTGMSGPPTQPNPTPGSDASGPPRAVQGGGQ